MTPSKLSKSDTEHAHQVALFAYCAFAYNHGFDLADKWSKEGMTPELKALTNSACGKKHQPVPALEWIHAIPNGGSRGDNEKSRKIRGAQLKSEGVRSGIADVFLPWPAAHWHGLYIEMKKPSQRPKRITSKGGMSDEQIKFKNYALNVGFGFMTCYSWEQAASVIRSYVEYKKEGVS